MSITPIKKIVPLFFLLIFSGHFSVAQLQDSCKLKFGTNLSGISDWSSEQPFVNMMRYCRQWYTKDVGNPNPAWNSELADELVLRADGYPTHVPQSVASSTFMQRVSTIWGATDGWESGNYVILFEGTGTLSFGGNYSNLSHPSANRYTFTLANPANGIFELVIETSITTDPVRNIRIVRDIYESTYLAQPFNPTWIEKLQVFKNVRFMDWGQTNNFGQNHSWEWQDTTRFKWSQRAKYNYYTWSTNKGVPYEMMAKLMNDYNLDGWVCVPHNASDNYMREMAKFFRDSVSATRKITVEYSNETWNWMFGQAQWLNEYGCLEKGISWPEGTAPYVQNCLDIWSQEWANDLPRLTRVAGVQTGWLDVAQRVIFNIDTSSFDAVAATYYFGLSSEADSILDGLGSNATVSDLSGMVRAHWQDGKDAITAIKTDVADSVQKDLVFYEGGQHLTAHPFGILPTYSQALLDIQRDTSMYNLYNQWFDFLRTLQSGNEPLELMNFSFIAALGAQYGSWGILENQYQDTALIYAPKYKAVIENQNFGCENTFSIAEENAPNQLLIFPNPAKNLVQIKAGIQLKKVEVYNVLGMRVFEENLYENELIFDVSSWTKGMYLVRVLVAGDAEFKRLKLIKI